MATLRNRAAEATADATQLRHALQNATAKCKVRPLQPFNGLSADINCSMQCLTSPRALTIPARACCGAHRMRRFIDHRSRRRW